MTRILLKTLFKHPALSQYKHYQDIFEDLSDLPNAAEIATKCNAHMKPSGLKFRPQTPLRKVKKVSPLRRYLFDVIEEGFIPTRDHNLHDFLNALSWLKYPDLKKDLVFESLQQMKKSSLLNRPSHVDALTRFDEGGLVLLVPKHSLPSALDIIQSKEDGLKMDIIRQSRILVIGHGLMEHLVTRQTTVYAFTALIPEDHVNQTTPKSKVVLKAIQSNQIGSLPMNERSLRYL